MSASRVTGVEAPGLDAYRASGLASCRPAVEGWCRDWWGAPELRPGRHCYEHTARWANGAELYYNGEGSEGPNREWCTLYLPGGCLAEWEFRERIAHTAELAELGLNRPTRADLAVDFHGQALTLLHELEAGRDRGELHGVRITSVIKPQFRFKGRSRLMGHTVYLGKRGSRAATVCAYDKGLELSKGKGESGRYVRWEARFEAESAQIVMARLWTALAGGGDVGATIGWGPGPDGQCGVAVGELRAEYVKLAFSPVDFRVWKGRDRHLRRSQRAAWWQAWVSLVEVEPERLRSGRRRYASLRRSQAWLARCVWPLLRACQRMRPGLSLGEVLETLGCGPRGRERRLDAVLLEYARQQIESAA